MKDKSAFTLVELLIAVSLSALMGFTIVGTFAGGVKLYQRIANLDFNQMTTVLVMDKLENDLKNTFYFSPIPFQIGSNRISFPGFVQIAQEDKNRNIVYREVIGKISYFLDSQSATLKRETIPYMCFNLSEDKKQKIQENLITVSSFNIVTSAKEETNQLFKSYSQLALPQEDAYLIPKIIKVQIVTGPEDKKYTLERKIVIPIK